MCCSLLFIVVKWVDIHCIRPVRLGWSRKNLTSLRTLHIAVSEVGAGMLVHWWELQGVETRDGR